MRPVQILAGVLAACLVGSQLAACSSSSISEALPDQRLVYKKQREAAENLEIPPDLAGSNFDDAMDIPDSGGMGSATFSQYAGSRERRQQLASSNEVLPEVSDVQLERSGDDRWLQVKGVPAQVWPKAMAFWREQGILLVEQNPAVGVMKTDWLDNRAEIRKDFLTKMLSKVMESAYSTSTRDQYTLRIDAGSAKGTTEIHLTHRGMAERMVSDSLGSGSRTIWEPSGTDHEKEAEMLRHLMVYLGASTKAAAASVATSTPPSQGQAPLARLATEGGMQVLVIPQEYRRAWTLTGSALDRAGFAVKDRDQSQGIYYVRYAGKDAAGTDMEDGEKPGLMSRMAFWRKKKDLDTVQQYQIKVSGNDSESRVSVLDAKGKPDQSASGQRILALMREQMR
mgnify:CR=1 FL=1